ncbi:MAG TPA: hypothetical protein VK849_01700 [Longimicrobiales bacterium]|nr:hypothetical protein [Longimicrobiales bacterium]
MMMRNVVAVVTGVLVVLLVVFALQWLGSLLYPLPEGLDPMDPAQREQVTEYMRGLPVSSWLLTFASELLGAFLGALVTGRMAGSRRAPLAGLIVLLAVVGSVTNWMAFPHPTLFVVGQLVGYPLVFLAARRMLTAQSPEAAATA